MFWAVQLPEILKLCPWKWEYDWICDTFVEWINTEQLPIIYVDYIETSFIIFQYMYYEVMKK
jgi:hypothetical protein